MRVVRTSRRILGYLHAKALANPQQDRFDRTPYATSHEIANNLGLDLQNTCNCLRILFQRGLVRKYPKLDTGKTRRKWRYGSAELPSITIQELNDSMPVPLAMMSPNGK